MYAAILIVLAVMIYGVVHSFLASVPVKEWVGRKFGGFGGRVYRISYNIFAAITILPVLALPNTLPDQTWYVISSPWRYVLLTIQGIAGVVLVIGVFQTDIWTFSGLRQLFFGGDVSDEQLVISGFYRWVRHPLYTAGFFLLWASPDMTRNGFALKLGLTIYLIAGAYIEERKLVKTFDNAYVSYSEKVPMFFPRFFHFKQ